MFFPVGKRRNHRYRGPMESQKVGNSQIELTRNIALLTTAFNTHAQNLNLLLDKMNDPVRSSIEQSIIKMRAQIDDLKKGE